MKRIHNRKLIKDIYDYDIILVGTGINNALGNGFQHDIKINFPAVEKSVKSEKYGDRRKLGTVTVIDYKKVIFCICHIHKGGYRKDINPDYLDYEALKECISLIDETFKDKKIATTLIGGSEFDGNGDEEKIIDILKNIKNSELTVYDYKQRDYREEDNEKWANIISKVGEIPYIELKELKEKYKWERKYGIYVPYNKENKNNI